MISTDTSRYLFQLYPQNLRDVNLRCCILRQFNGFLSLDYSLIFAKMVFIFVTDNRGKKLANLMVSDP